jgi:hypothetical protein
MPNIKIPINDGYFFLTVALVCKKNAPACLAGALKSKVHLIT